jgi:hypothetical protein
MDSCNFPGCDRPVREPISWIATKYCDNPKHNPRSAFKVRQAIKFPRNSRGIVTPEAKAKMSKAKIGNTNGVREIIGQSGMHKRLDKARGKPRLCEHCGTTEAKRYEWAYTGPGHDSGIGAWSMNLKDYIRLCHKCHKIFDNFPGTRAWIESRRSETKA